MNMDYSLSEAMKYNSDGIKDTLVMYDIMCQYGVHLRDRFSQSAYLDIPPELNIKEGIGIWHVNGHLPKCYCRFCPLFIDGAGHVDGEIIETLWSSLNEVSGSTRGMTHAHRRELLDDHMNNSNWGKLTRIGECQQRCG